MPLTIQRKKKAITSANKDTLSQTHLLKSLVFSNKKVDQLI